MPTVPTVSPDPAPATADIRAGRLPAETIALNFADIAPRYDAHQAMVAADRCYFCHDAPCVAACPTEIDIPLFIREIQSGVPEAAARTIFAQNILGGMCARVCPTETLCEGACVREAAEGKPVEIGRLQRYATDILMTRESHPFARAAPSGKRVAVVGAGPAGLSCAHRLAMLGHDVVIFEARAKGGGLNEYGIAAYKSPDGFAQAELDWLLGIGGIEIRYGQALGREVTLGGLRADYDAIFLGIGLACVRRLEAEGAEASTSRPAVDFIADLRQAEDLARVPVGRRVIVIGGGMTAVDAAVQSKLLGADEVTMVYRGPPERMGASRHEQDHAARAGVRIVHRAVPLGLRGAADEVEAAFARTTGTDAPEHWTLAADLVLTAIGQTLGALPEEMTAPAGRIVAAAGGRTDLAGVWAGGDCTSAGEDLTVTAVAQGRDAAIDIHAALTGQDAARRGDETRSPRQGVVAGPAFRPEETTRG